jgi:hypothetical protein
VAAARGEIVGFQLAVEAGSPLSAVHVSVSDLRGATGVIGADRIRICRVWYVPAAGRWHGEFAIPLEGGFALPAVDNAVPNQRVQAVGVDIAVPAAAEPGAYRGQVLARCEGEAVSLDLELVVYPATLPAEMSFNAELNCYSPPGGEAGSPYFYEAHRLAHYHRCTINTVAYSQVGLVTRGYAPELRRDGADVEVTDWDEFDRLMGPLLDGSAFAGSPRGRLPVRTFYLPFFEHWPLPLWEYYPYRGDPKDEAVLMQHAYEAPPIEEMLPPEYGAAMEKVAREFVRHCEEKGWRATDFQMYLNNKTHFGGTWWTLDEPADRPDWLANRYFAQCLKQGTAGATTTHFMFRGDISRPQWQYDLLDGLMDTIYYNNQIFDNPAVATRLMNRRLPDPHVYGHFSAVEVAHHGTALWCLKAAALGLNGVLPWQCLGEAEALRDPGTAGTNLIVPGDLAGYPGPVASLRVLAARRGAQDVELLLLLGRRRGYTAEQLGSIIAQKLTLAGQAEQQFLDEAASVRFEQFSAEAFAELKEGLLLALSEG